MVLNKKIVTQKKYSQLHRYLVAFFLVYLMERYAQSNSKGYILPFAVILPVFLADFILAVKDYFNNRKILYVLRFIQITIATGYAIIAEFPYNMAIAILCLVLFFAEYIMAFDYEDVYYRTIAIATGAIPPAVMLIIDAIVAQKIKDRLFPLACVFLILIIFISFVVTLYAKAVNEYNFQVFAKSRLIEDVNQTNEDLRINQEKVKKSNELLGMQKVKLEQAYKEINSINNEMMIQNEIVKYISSSLDIENLMTLITESVLEGMGLDTCILVLNQTEDQNVKYKARTKYGMNEDKEFGELIKKGHFNRYLADSKVFVDNDVEAQKYALPTKSDAGSLLMVPLIKNENQIGLMIVTHAKKDYFTSNVGFFEGIVAQFLVAIDNANLYAKMERMATHDGLTGIYNRGHLTKRFNEFLNASILNKTSLTVALFDIDKFKKVNDSYGHLFGDVVIKTIASLAKEVADDNNAIVGRYGGEEFVIVFPNRGLDDSLKLVEDLHKRIRDTELIHNGESIHINTSIGITSYPETCKNPSELLNRADWAMYYSKQNGRGRVTIDSDFIRESVLLK
ncbi:sensor domain-containing diguanylate cyclase [Anaerosporobacter faecicola]|uniref:sensor domain-containing diguanylate cyclase n=1 Tax=Anaerosporobacter faecicola TaxID=2718714 RepID=UPI00143C0657|nr:sensor domain-containing diguanylate cyclase [Anaerosporobacter faecicola]